MPSRELNKWWPIGTDGERESWESVLSAHIDDDDDDDDEEEEEEDGRQASWYSFLKQHFSGFWI